MSSLSEFYFSFDPIWRAAAMAGLAFLAIEAFKPGFAFSEVETDDGEAFVARSFLKDNHFDEQIVPGTFLPWWMIVGGALVLFGLFI